jgi:hypothetical protein
VPVILCDANIEGHAAHIWMRMQSAEWRELTTAFDVTFQTFREAGLDPAASDDAVWRSCQSTGLYLLTSNRNEENDSSLGATIRREGTPTSLPVFTLPMADRVYSSPAFLERVVDKLLTYILDAENIRGAGRLYVP